MHIILIKPDLPDDIPFERPLPEVHLGLASIAAILERNHFKVSVIDNFLNRENVERLAERVRTLNPDVVGVNCDLVSIGNVRKIVGAVKKLGIPTVVGGPEVSVHPKDTFLRTKPDICVYGEGELTMLELCQLIDSFGLDAKKLEPVKGVVYSKDGDVKINPPRPLIRDLDILPFMALHLFPMDRYERKSELGITPTDLICTSRGCPFQCSFCSNEFVWGKKVRAMSPERVVDEIQYLIKNYGTKAVYFREDNFTINRKRVLGICREINNRGLNIKWMCESRVDCIDEELLEIMKEAGCGSIWFGVESGSQRVLDMLKKGTTLQQARKAFKLCAQCKIKSGASVMLGIPGETKDEIKKTVEFVESIDPYYIFFNPFLGIPGSEIYPTIERKNLVYKRYGTLVLPNTEDLTWPEKEEFVRFASFHFYFSHPRRIWRKIRIEGLSSVLLKSIRVLRSAIFRWRKFPLRSV